MTLPIRHLSPSSIALYERCPLAWKLRYIDQVSEPMNAPMAFGRTMAFALEALHRGDDADLELVQQHARLAAELAIDGLRLQPGADYGLNLLRLYRERDGGPFSGIPERRFSFHAVERGMVPLPFFGYMDLEAVNDLGTPVSVVEFKTAAYPATRWTQEVIDNDLQAWTYAWAFKRAHAYWPTEVRFIVLGTRTPSITELVTTPGPDHARLLEIRAGVMWNAVKAGKFDACGKRTCFTCKPADVESDLQLVMDGDR